MCVVNVSVCVCVCVWVVEMALVVVMVVEVEACVSEMMIVVIVAGWTTDAQLHGLARRYPQTRPSCTQRLRFRQFLLLQKSRCMCEWEPVRGCRCRMCSQVVHVWVGGVYYGGRGRLRLSRVLTYAWILRG